MNESLSSASDKTGLPPGSLVLVDSVLVDETTMSVIDYSKESLVEHEIHLILVQVNKIAITGRNCLGQADMRCGSILEGLRCVCMGFLESTGHAE